MPRDGSGNYTLPTGNPVVTNTVISSNGWANPTLSDIASALTSSISKDGQTTPTADLTMGNFKLRNLAAAIARTDAVNAGQVQDGTLTVLSSVSGTDTITASSAPAITAYTAGQQFSLISAGINATRVVTLNINALGAKNVMKMGPNGLVQLSPGDIQSGQIVDVYYDGTQFQLISNIPQNQPIGYSNKLINGNFDVWQSGTSFNNTATNAANSYAADGWQCFRSGFANGYTASRITAGPTGSRFSLRMQRTAGDTSTQLLEVAQSFESNDVVKLQNNTVNANMQAFASGAFIGATLTLAATFGTGTDGSIAAGFTGQFGTVSTTITLTGSNQQISLPISVPSNATQMGIFAFISPSSTAAGASDYFQISQAQVNDGASPLPFERRNYGQEFAICQRYYQQVSSVQMWAYAGAAAPIGMAVSYREMRAAPTAVFNGTPTFSNCAGITINSLGTNALTLFATVTALGNASWSTGGAINLNARL